MDAVHFVEACVKLARERGITKPLRQWSFAERESIVRAVEATSSPPPPVIPPIRSIHGGASAAIPGGTGKLLEQ